MVPLLGLVALAMAVYGVVLIVGGSVAVGVLMLVLACAIGPGGWWLLT